MNKNHVIDILSNMPINEADDFTIKLKDFVIEKDMIKNQNLLYAIMESKQDLQIRFAAFYALKIIYRKYGNYSKLIEFVDRYGEPFRNFKLYDIVLSTYYRNKIILGEKEWGRAAIKHAETACMASPTNLAIKHHYAETVVFLLEENLEVTQDEISKAIDRLDDVIAVYNRHAKYYCTKGRLLAAKKEYKSAIKSINKALGLEVVNDKDAMIRIGQYNYYLLRVHMLENNLMLDDKIQEFDDSMEKSNLQVNMLMQNIEDMKTRYLEYLAFFSSILAFIMVTINVAISVEEFNKAVGLILVLAGALVITFVLFRVLLPYSSYDKHIFIKTFICIIASIFLIVIGIACGNEFMERYINNIILGI